MRYPSKLVLGSITLSLALNVGAATDVKENVKSKASPTARPSAVSDAPPATVPTESGRTDASPVPGAVSTPAPAVEPSEVAAVPGKSKRLVVRGRLDDGRYLGFHQHGTEEIRIGNPVQSEIDRLHRAPQPAK